MTDEQRPCKHGPWAYRGDFQSGVRYCVGCGVDATTLVNAERTRADAAEAQRDRLAAALRAYCRAHDEEVAIAPCLCDECEEARAALADVRDAEPPPELVPLLAKAVRAKREGREQYAMSADEYAEKLSREADLVPWPDNLTRGTPNLAAPDVDRARRRDEAYRAMVEALGFARAVMDEDCDDHGCTHPGCVVYRCVSAALALARQVEEG